MVIKCYFAIIVMVDTISSTSSRSSLKFLSTFGIVHHVLLQHLDFLLKPCHVFPWSGLGGGIHDNFSSASSCALYIYVHASFFG
jgi:hypothetical protein